MLLQYDFQLLPAGRPCTPQSSPPSSSDIDKHSYSDIGGGGGGGSIATIKDTLTS